MRRCAFSSVPRPSKTGQGTYQGISSAQCRKDQDMPEVHVFYQGLSCFSHVSIVSSFYPPQTFSGVLIIVTPANAQPPASSSVSSSSLASCEETGCSRWTKAATNIHSRQVLGLFGLTSAWWSGIQHHHFLHGCQYVKDFHARIRWPTLANQSINCCFWFPLIGGR